MSKLKRVGTLVFILFAGLVLIMDGTHVSATVPYIAERVNLDPSGNQMTNGNIQDPPIISQDGRYVAFSTNSSNIVTGDTNSAVDVFVRDRKLGTTVRATLDSAGGELPSSPYGYGGYTMSANGRFVIFTYGAAGVVPGDTNGTWDVFLRDLKNNTTEMVSLTSTGGLPNGQSNIGNISADGRYVVFTSSATNLVPGDTNGKTDVFVRDRKLGTTKLLSQSSAGVLADGNSYTPSISCDGSYVTFISSATNLVPGDTNGVRDVFLIDRITNAISDITINANNNASIANANISCNGETINFISPASNIVSGDTNNEVDLFAYNMIDATFELVDVDTLGGVIPSSGISTGQRAGNMDFSGRYIVFSTNSSTLVSGDTNNTSDVFLRDIRDDTTQIISKRDSTTQTVDSSFYPSISLSGTEITFVSADTGLVPGDTNSRWDVFVSKTGI